MKTREMIHFGACSFFAAVIGTRQGATKGNVGHTFFGLSLGLALFSKINKSTIAAYFVGGLLGNYIESQSSALVTAPETTPSLSV